MCDNLSVTKYLAMFKSGVFSKAAASIENYWLSPSLRAEPWPVEFWSRFCPPAPPCQKAPLQVFQGSTNLPQPFLFQDSFQRFISTHYLNSPQKFDSKISMGKYLNLEFSDCQRPPPQNKIIGGQWTHSLSCAKILREMLTKYLELVHILQNQPKNSHP